jgi:hypothetical protein
VTFFAWLCVAGVPAALFVVGAVLLSWRLALAGGAGLVAIVVIWFRLTRTGRHD